ncbi:hypothetical protein MXB_3633 [Myxobolus squamalis]|nr:hypothetical protein MXB_3633 [Myxobolus squamalis]
MGWIFGGAIDLTDDALCLRKKNNMCQIDETYRIALHPFYQALVILTFDHAMSCFVPCIRYLHLFHEIIVTLDWVWEPEAIPGFWLLFPLETSNRSKNKNT